jgi:hypothetical protein
MLIDGPDSGDVANAPIHRSKVADHTRGDDGDGCACVNQGERLKIPRSGLQPLGQPLHRV